MLGDTIFPLSAQLLIELDPNFSPAQPISKTVLRSIACNLHEVQRRHKAKLERLGLKQQRETSTPPHFP